MSAFTSPPDEGFSEYPMESQNLSESSVAIRDLPSYVSQMSVHDRAQLAVQILNGLPAADFSRVIEAMKPRLFINFFHQLPSEICLKIFGFLDPDSLIRAAQTSLEWMTLAMDPHLWQELYYQEGFRTIQSEIKKFEIEQAGSVIPRRPRSLGSAADGHTNKKRATINSMRDNLDEIPSYQADLFASVKGKGRPEQSSTEDEEMLDAEQTVLSTQQSLFGGKHGNLRGSRAQLEDKGLLTDSDGNSSGGVIRIPRNIRKSHTPSNMIKSFSEPNPRNPLNSDSKGSRLVKPGLYLREPDSGRLKLNWHHIYTQRRRLESNWETGKYINFQLPHPEHPEEAHGECVYTIQYSGQYLVSGSRDTTVRIWNLDTRRLVRAPLRGHKGSVLCLQFDADPEEDIIVSGSSDSDVIIWKFSTGQQIQRLHNAHRESVLNVRFDKRILVTCSKDNTIKIFNRRPIVTQDPIFPNVQGVDLVPKVLSNFGYNPSPSAGIPLKPAYSLVGSLSGHQAAVNAVQILNDEIVSASGDRTVKVWDWPRGVCTRNLIGHNKGIACVQYDGRRIVSGSSDNEVKVFDSATGVEVASLRGHSNLVRTVQAGFGDLPYSIEEDQEEAKATDAEYFQAVEKGMVSQASSNSRRRRKNAGSRNPEDITAIGAKLPPGGGGGRYGRIVSGSYDETVIIWRRDKSGVWKPQHTLRQEEAARAAARLARPRPIPTVARLTQNALDTFDIPSTQPPRPTPNLSTDSAIHVNHIPAGPSNLASSISAPVASSPADPTNSTTLPISSEYIHHFRILLETAVNAGPDTLRTVFDAHPILLRLPSLPNLIAQQSPHGLRSELRNIVNASLITNEIQLATTITRFEQEPNILAGAAQAAVQMTLAIQMQQQQAARDRLANSIANARVFKLQFDARRIVCCSQMRVIVGWDFGAGDEEILEAARFFAPVE